MNRETKKQYEYAEKSNGNLVECITKLRGKITQLENLLCTNCSCADIHVHEGMEDICFKSCTKNSMRPGVDCFEKSVGIQIEKYKDKFVIRNGINQYWIIEVGINVWQILGTDRTNYVGKLDECINKALELDS